MGSVRLEILPWSKRPFDRRNSGRLVLTERIEEGETVGELFTRLVREHSWFGEMVFDGSNASLSGHISVIHNDVLLELSNGLATELGDGDTITLVHVLAGAANWQYIIAC